MQFDQKTIMIGVSLLGTISSFAMGGNQLSGMNKAREQYSHQREVLSNVENSETIRLAQEKIANARYENCELLARGSFQKGFTFPPISKMTRVTDRHTGEPLAQNTVVCDSYGQTAMLAENGMVDMRTVAFTGQRDRIAKRMARYRGGNYAQPVMEDK